NTGKTSDCFTAWNIFVNQISNFHQPFKFQDKGIGTSEKGAVKSKTFPAFYCTCHFLQISFNILHWRYSELERQIIIKCAEFTFMVCTSSGNFCTLYKEEAS